MRTKDQITQDIIEAMHDSAATVNDVLKLCSELAKADECQTKCKDCKHYAPFVFNRIGGVEIPTTHCFCYKHGEEVDPGDTCEYAERKGKE